MAEYAAWRLRDACAWMKSWPPRLSRPPARSSHHLALDADRRDPMLLTVMREAMITAVTRAEPTVPAEESGPAPAARALRAALPDKADVLSDAEQALLHRVAHPPRGGRRRRHGPDTPSAPLMQTEDREEIVRGVVVAERRTLTAAIGRTGLSVADVCDGDGAALDLTGRTAPGRAASQFRPSGVGEDRQRGVGNAPHGLRVQSGLADRLDAADDGQQQCRQPLRIGGAVDVAMARAALISVRSRFISAAMVSAGRPASGRIELGSRFGRALGQQTPAALGVGGGVFSCHEVHVSRQPGQGLRVRPPASRSSATSATAVHQSSSTRWNSLRLSPSAPYRLPLRAGDLGDVVHRVPA
ncbi:hypothetical protein [Streptomyces sp. KL116D]|uniref:hypothetical protein n=1 Tax=Streptomyces sp. KL116D TaxID=3045152 RepID=UPI0035560AB0